MITLLELAACVSALGTIVAPSLVIAVLLLVGTFLATGVWLLIVGSGFVGIAYLLVYIGAIAILFLFVVMLMDLRDLKAASTGDSDNTLPLALLSGILVLGLTQLGNADGSSWIYPTGVSFVAGQDLLVESSTQLLAIGSLLFQEGTLPLIIAAVLLLVAIIGPLTLCLPKNNLSSNHIVVIIFLL